MNQFEQDKPEQREPIAQSEKDSPPQFEPHSPIHYTDQVAAGVSPLEVIKTIAAMRDRTTWTPAEIMSKEQQKRLLLQHGIVLADTGELQMNGIPITLSPLRRSDVSINGNVYEIHLAGKKTPWILKVPVRHKETVFVGHQFIKRESGEIKVSVAMEPVLGDLRDRIGLPSNLAHVIPNMIVLHPLQSGVEYQVTAPITGQLVHFPHATLIEYYPHTIQSWLKGRDYHAVTDPYEYDVSRIQDVLTAMLDVIAFGMQMGDYDLAKTDYKPTDIRVQITDSGIQPVVIDPGSTESLSDTIYTGVTREKRKETGIRALADALIINLTNNELTGHPMLTERIPSLLQILTAPEPVPGKPSSEQERNALLAVKALMIIISPQYYKIAPNQIDSIGPPPHPLSAILKRLLQSITQSPISLNHNTLVDLVTNPDVQRAALSTPLPTVLIDLMSGNKSIYKTSWNELSQLLNNITLDELLALFIRAYIKDETYKRDPREVPQLPAPPPEVLQEQNKQAVLALALQAITIDPPPTSLDELTLHITKMDEQTIVRIITTLFNKGWGTYSIDTKLTTVLTTQTDLFEKQLDIWGRFKPEIQPFLRAVIIQWTSFHPDLPADFGGLLEKLMKLLQEKNRQDNAGFDSSTVPLQFIAHLITQLENKPQPATQASTPTNATPLPSDTPGPDILPIPQNRENNNEIEGLKIVLGQLNRLYQMVFKNINPRVINNRTIDTTLLTTELNTFTNKFRPLLFSEKPAMKTHSRIALANAIITLLSNQTQQSTTNFVTSPEIFTAQIQPNTQEWDTLLAAPWDHLHPSIRTVLEVLIDLWVRSSLFNVATPPETADIKFDTQKLDVLPHIKDVFVRPRLKNSDTQVCEIINALITTRFPTQTAQ